MKKLKRNENSYLVKIKDNYILYFVIWVNFLKKLNFMIYMKYNEN